MAKKKGKKKHGRKPPKSARRASALERFDAAVATEATAHAGNPLVRILGAFSTLADQPPLIAGSVATIVAGGVLRRPRLVRAGARMLASELLATGAKALVKHHVARTRPGKMLKDGRYALHHDKDGDKDDGPWNSFPSGHTAGAAAVGRALVREYPAAAPVAALAGAVVAVMQLPRGAHFPSDVAAGGVIGLAAEAAVDRAARALG